MVEFQRSVSESELAPEHRAALRGERDDVLCLPFAGLKGDLSDFAAIYLYLYGFAGLFFGLVSIVMVKVEGDTFFAAIMKPLFVAGAYFLIAAWTRRLYPRSAAPFRGDRTQHPGVYLLPDCLIAHEAEGALRRTTVIPRYVIRRVRFGNEEGVDVEGLSNDLLVTVALPEGTEELRIPELIGRRDRVEGSLNAWFESAG